MQSHSIRSVCAPVQDTRSFKHTQCFLSKFGGGYQLMRHRNPVYHPLVFCACSSNDTIIGRKFQSFPRMVRQPPNTVFVRIADYMGAAVPVKKMRTRPVKRKEREEPLKGDSAAYFQLPVAGSARGSHSKCVMKIISIMTFRACIGQTYN